MRSLREVLIVLFVNLGMNTPDNAFSLFIMRHPPFH